MAQHPVDVSGHTVKSYDQELARVRGQLLEMGGLVEDQIGWAVKALVAPDLAVVDQVFARHPRIRDTATGIDRACTHIIARRQPMGRDLRMLLASIKTAGELSNIAEEAHKIARMVHRLYHSSPSSPALGLFRGVADSARQATVMVRGCLDAFARGDPEHAQWVIDQDDELDDLYHAAMAHLTALMTEDRSVVHHAVDVVFIHKSLEHIGDHAKTIAEHVVGLLQGPNPNAQDPSPASNLPSKPWPLPISEGAATGGDTPQRKRNSKPAASKYAVSVSRSARVSG
ncbi:MAG: phosphate signaling complex protein PhoU [Candidatus Competibacterales bacterium]